jgi:hypothetical protein
LEGRPKRKQLESSDEKGVPKKITEDISVYQVSKTDTATSSKMNRERNYTKKTELKETECNPKRK